MFNKRTSIILFLGVLAVGHATADVNRVHQIQNEYKGVQAKWQSAQNRHAHLVNDLAVSDRRLGELAADQEHSKKAYGEVQKLERDNPQLDVATAVKEAAARNREDFGRYQQEEAQNKKLRGELAGAESDTHRYAAELNTLSGKIKREADVSINEEVTKRTTGLKATRTVIGYAEVGCGQESLTDCQSRARKAAERDATEKGSVTVVESVTNIENFQLTKDQVKSEVTAQLSDTKVLEKGWVNDTTYKYKIETVVTPIVGPSLLEKMRGAIAVDLGIEVPPPVAAGVAVSAASSAPSGSTRVGSKAKADQAFEELDRETGRSNNKLAANANLEQQQQDARAQVRATESRATPKQIGGDTESKQQKQRRNYMTF